MHIMQMLSNCGNPPPGGGVVDSLGGGEVVCMRDIFF
jgi:hypothetical protein